MLSTLLVGFTFSEKRVVPSSEAMLGDRYSINAKVGDTLTDWDVRKVGLTKAEVDLLVAELVLYAGVTGFSWQPTESYPLKTYICEDWTVTERGVDVYEISGTFSEDVKGQCISFQDKIDTAQLTAMFAGANTWLATYTRDTNPFMVSSLNLVKNSFHDVLGRGGYFPASAGPTEGQAVMARACCVAYQATGDSAWLNRALQAGNALTQYFYNKTIPTNVNTFYSPHWLINVRPSFTSKGPTSPNPLSYGAFDVSVSFTNGVGILPSGDGGLLLSNVYKAYSTNGLLLWKHIYAPLIQGTEYLVDYWVSNWQLQGQSLRIYADTESSGGTPPVSTAEQVGTIKLVSNFTGTLKLVYTTYSGPAIASGQLFESFPCWRSLLPGESLAATDVYPWAWDAYDLLFRLTLDSKWSRARDATAYTFDLGANIQTVSHFYKPEADTNPLRYPGSQVIVVDNTNGFTASRVGSGNGAITNWLRVDVATPTGLYPSVEVQNYAITVQVITGVQILVQAACSQAAFLEVVLSTSTNAFDLTQLYRVFFKVEAGSASFQQRTHEIWEFVRWNYGFESQYLAWYPSIAEEPVYVFSGGGGSASYQPLISDSLPINSTQNTRDLFTEISLDPGAGGYAGAGLLISLGAKTRRPPRLRLKVVGADVIYRITDGSGGKWDYLISSGGGWKTVDPGWDAMTRSPQDTVGLDQNRSEYLAAVEFNATTAASTVSVYWAATSATTEPERLSELIPVEVTKASLVSRQKTAHTLWCGIFRPVNNPLDSLPYVPGVFPFTVNAVYDSIDSWRGEPFVGYQNAWYWGHIGRQTELQNTLQFLKDSQDDYAKKYGEVGPFTPVYHWAYWDTLATSKQQLNTFDFTGVDPNTNWSPYAFRPLEACARAWFEDRQNPLAKLVTMRFLTFIDNFYFERGNAQPITDFYVDGRVLSNYHEPHAAALILRAALYANLAGGDPVITFRVINQSLTYIQSQYVSSGTMLGSFSAGQPTFDVSGVTYRQYFGFWHFEIVEAIAQLLKYRNQITYPPCDTALTPNRVPDELSTAWKFSGYREGAATPTSYGWSLSASNSSLWGSDAIAVNTGTDQSVKLQSIIDRIHLEYPSRNYDQLVLLTLPAGEIRINRQVMLSTSFLVLSGSGSDPATGTKIMFRPDTNTRYDVDLSGSGTSDGEDFDLGSMTNGTVSGGLIFPGRSCFKIQSKRVHPRYTNEFNSAPENRKDFYYGSFNYTGRTAIPVEQDAGAYVARQGDTILPIDGDLLGVYPGGYILVYGANTRTWYNQIGVTNTAHHRAVPVVRTRIHRVKTILSGNQVELDTPLEFDIPRNQTADGDSSISSDSSFTSNILPLDAVMGVGIQDLYIEQPMSGVPAVAGGSYTLTPSQAKNNYTNLASEYALHGIVLRWAVNCFVRGVRTYMTGSHPVATEFVKNITIEGCYFEGSWNKGKGGNGYLRISKCWDSLIRRNTILDVRHMTAQWSSSYNVYKENTLNADINLHGGWERFNLFEQNTGAVPYAHKFGDTNASNPSNGSTWYPIWWGAGLHAGKWSSTTGQQNIFFNNVLTKQLEEGGAFLPFGPYSNKEKIYVFGTNQGSSYGTNWEHLQVSGANISAWHTRELLDYARFPNSGLNSSADYTGQSLHDLVVAQAAISPSLGLSLYPGAHEYNVAGIPNYFLHISGKTSTVVLDGSSKVSSASNIAGTAGSVSSPASGNRPGVGSVNNFRVFTFDGNDVFTPSSNIAAETVITWGLVLRTDPSVGTGERIMQVTHGTESYHLYMVSPEYTKVGLGFFSSSSFVDGIFAAAGEVPKGGWIVLTLSIDYVSHAASLWIYGYTKRTGVLAGTAGTFTAAAIGGRTNLTDGFTGSIAEIVAFKGLLSDYQQYSLMQNLMDKYKI